MSEIEYQNIEGFPSQNLLKKIVEINQDVFGFGETAENLSKALSGRHHLLTCLAFEDDRLVGFKIGFEERPHYFESWRGGVLQSHRGQGIAKKLLENQHEWCKNKGFRIVTTITNNTNISMLIVNLRGGFEIVGTIFDRRNHVKVHLQKWLVPIPD
ncbi:MAG: GNAT family N-acetyltransferase [Proteobacteria bacterium]|nr:GNAT family N-acetyltransferase [Pseudomonadota bacterium]